MNDRVLPDRVARPPAVYFRMCVAYNSSMTRIVEAIYADGVLEPLESLDLPERQRVRLTIEPINGNPPGDRQAAMQRLIARLQDSAFSHGGPYPSRDELHER